jgi:hypothetical protein
VGAEPVRAKKKAAIGLDSDRRQESKPGGTGLPCIVPTGGEPFKAYVPVSVRPRTDQPSAIERAAWKRMWDWLFADHSPERDRVA